MHWAARATLRVAAPLSTALLGLTGNAIAATLVDALRLDDRSDQTQDQEDAINADQDAEQARQAAGMAAPSAPKEFSSRVNAPLYYNSNAITAQSGGPAALETDPAIELGWARGLTSAPLKLSIVLRADADHYANVPTANQDEASGLFKAAYYDADNDQAWVPFLSYKSTGIYDGSRAYETAFSRRTETRNDFALGFDRIFDFDGDFHLLPTSARSRESAIWRLGFSAYVQRRLRTPGPNSVAAYFVPSVTYSASKEWTVSLVLNTRERWFDQVTFVRGISSGRSFEIEPIATIAYDPRETPTGGDSVARRLLGAVQIALQIGFENRSSSIPNNSWNQWNVGPVLTANWRF